MERPIQNCYWVEPGKLLAGEYPREYDHAPSVTKFRALRGAGVSAFIDLTQEVEAQAWGWVKPYDDYLDGASHERFPIPDEGVPDSSELTTAVLDAIDRRIAEGRTVYVHCLAAWGAPGPSSAAGSCVTDAPATRRSNGSPNCGGSAPSRRATRARRRCRSSSTTSAIGGRAFPSRAPAGSARTTR